MNRGMGGLRILLAGIGVGIMCLVAVFNALSLPVNSDSGTSQSTLGGLLFFALLHIGAAILFLFGLKGFNEEFKKAYRFISAGVVLLGISTMALPLLAYISSWKGPLITYVPTFVYIVGMVAIYLGVRIFARLLQVRHITMHSWFGAVVFVGVAAILWLFPHAINSYGSELQFDLAQAIVGLELSLSFVNVWLLVRVVRTVAATYRTAIRWFIAAMGANLFAATFYLAKDYGFLPISEEAVGFPYVLGAFLYLIAAYQFAKISHRPAQKAVPGSTLVDCIVFTASLASNTRQIDSMLDELRVVTSTMDPKSAALTHADTAKLERVYLALESYLIHKEPVRSFTRTSLRQEIAHRFEDVPAVMQIIKA